MIFDVKSEEGLQEFNEYLEDKSYIDGYILSQNDMDVLKQFETIPSWTLINVLRWYNHIKSFSDDFQPLQSPQAEEITCKAEKTEEIKDMPVKLEEDEDLDLFASDNDEEENAEATRIREERLKAYAEQKSKKPTIVAKSSVLFDVKPWDDETDMHKMEELVRSIEMAGLVWGASKLVPVGYGINKFQIMCVIEDSVSVDYITETIEGFEQFVQSVDIAAFNKI